MKSLFYFVVLYYISRRAPGIGAVYRRPVPLLLGWRGEGDIAARDRIAYTVRLECRHLRIQLWKFRSEARRQLHDGRHRRHPC